ncbi:MAG TPA: FKBP-type peptidyl-prolyl cis-trans isomerase [Salinivirgaceae bacterium]|nr:FKBP-type peptidyl-prolyl cis-trans isomerase [Salinivirgaceae bacterium]
MRKIVFGIVCLLIVFGCGNREKKQKHPKGFKYIEHRRSEYGLSPRVGDIMYLNLRITAPNDSVLEEASNIIMQLQNPPKYEGTIEDALMFMHRGDSMSFFINARNFYLYSRQTPSPIHFSDNDELRFDIGMVDVMTFKKYEEMRRTKIHAGFLEERILLDQFLEKMPKRRIELDSMLYYIPDVSGDGPKVASGDIVSIHYLGYFIDGSLFANTYKKGNPFTFTVGDTTIITGLNRAIVGLKQGEKGRIIIPSYHAYGEKGVKDLIPPYATLVFEIEILSVVKSN